jgi:hypothetical protein
MIFQRSAVFALAALFAWFEGGVAAAEQQPRRVQKTGKNGPPPPPPPGPSKKSQKSSKKNRPTPSPVTPPTPAPTTLPFLDVPGTAEEYGFTTLVTALTAANLVETLAFPNGPYTVFAPTNAAFGRLGQELLGCLLLPRYQDVLQDVLLYHVADEELLAQQLFNDQVINMMNTDSILITIDDGTVVINSNADVVEPNLIATNGILHGIDRVLIPEELNVEEFLETCTSGLVSGCYGSQSTRAAGYQFGACDCEMTKEECDAEPKDGQFPIWAPGGCANICLCTSGFGCYQAGPDPPETQNNCDCSPEACAGGEDTCSAKGDTFFWTDGCGSCQCPSDEYDPPCKPKKEPAPAPEPTPGMGCYVSQSVRDAGYEFGACDCTMTEEECKAEPKEGAFPIWTDGCEDICLCEAGFGCYQLDPEPAVTQHTCDCSSEACTGGAEACSAQGELFLWSGECETCQCPFDYVPTCKPKQPEPEPVPPTGMGCYVSQSVRDAGYENGACDCEMTEAECKAEPKIDAFPIWTDGCEDICLCTTGPGCYQLAPEPVETQHTCDCSSATCAGGEEACNDAANGYLWSNECTSCQCPFDSEPTCKPKQDPSPGPTPGSAGCYMSQSVRDAGYENGACDCEMTAGECLAEPKSGPFPIWEDNGGCAGICLCTMGSGCYQLAREPSDTQHTCDCSPEICAGGEDKCKENGVGHVWSEECTSCQCPLLPTIPTECKARSGSDVEPEPEPEPEPPVDTGFGCYQAGPVPPETQHTCDCSPEICAGGEDKCKEKGVGHVWSEECTSCQCPEPVL